MSGKQFLSSVLLPRAPVETNEAATLDYVDRRVGMPDEQLATLDDFVETTVLAAGYVRLATKTITNWTIETEQPITGTRNVDWIHLLDEDCSSLYLVKSESTFTVLESGVPTGTNDATNNVSVVRRRSATTQKAMGRAAAIRVPPVPTNLEVVVLSATSVLIRWNPARYATGYYTFYKKTAASSGVSGFTTEPCLLITGLTTNTSYDFKVRSRGIVNSDYCAVVTKVIV